MPEQSFEQSPTTSAVVSESVINGPNIDNSPVVFSAEEMARTGDCLEVYLADDPNPIEINFPTENFVNFYREVRDDIYTKGHAQIDLLDDMYPQGPGAQMDEDRLTISLGRGSGNFGGLGLFESPWVSRKHCQISFDLVNKTLAIENFENTTNATTVIRKHKEENIDDLISSTDDSASSEPEAPASGETGILKKHFDRFMGKFEQNPRLFEDFGAASKEASYRDAFFENEDRLVVDENAGVFAVFDGMGGGKGAALAADIAAETTAKYFKALNETDITNPQAALDDLKTLVGKINTEILGHPGSGKAGTTAVITRLIVGEDGVKSLAWASVGDSRLYMIKGTGSRPKQITTDETIDLPDRRRGSVLTNCLGWGEGSFKGVNCAGILEVNAGDRLIICTDGVTGDEGKELMSELEIEELTMGLNASQAAQSLVQNARKNDDRTAIVVDL